MTRVPVVRAWRALPGELVFAWGSQAGRLGRLVGGRARAVRELVEGAGGHPVALATTQAGAPRHPLYLSGDLVPRAWP